MSDVNLKALSRLVALVSEGYPFAAVQAKIKAKRLDLIAPQGAHAAVRGAGAVPRGGGARPAGVVRPGVAGEWGEARGAASGLGLPQHIGLHRGLHWAAAAC